MNSVWTTNATKYTKTAKERRSFFAPFATFEAFAVQNPPLHPCLIPRYRLAHKGLVEGAGRRGRL
jgi:hypothetical protein